MRTLKKNRLFVADKAKTYLILLDRTPRSQLRSELLEGTLITDAYRYFALAETLDLIRDDELRNVYIVGMAAIVAQVTARGGCVGIDDSQYVTYILEAYKQVQW